MLVEWRLWNQRFGQISSASGTSDLHEPFAALPRHGPLD